MNIASLVKKKGLREAKFELARLQAELIAMEPERAEVLDPEELAPQFHALIGTLPEERFAVAFLNQSRKLLGIKVMEDGGSTTRTTLYPRKLFKMAFDMDATGIVLCHNHPGGMALPSAQDRALTRKIEELGDSLEIRLIDHIIVVPKEGGHSSFRRNGWL